MVGPGEGWVHGRSATIKPHPSMWARGCLVRGARNQIPTFRHSLSDVSVFDVPRQMLIIPLSLFHALVGRMIKARHGNPFLNFPPDLVINTPRHEKLWFMKHIRGRRDDTNEITSAERGNLSTLVLEFVLVEFFEIYIALRYAWNIDVIFFINRAMIAKVFRIL